MLAVCDENILGKTLKDAGFEFFVDPRFYKEDAGNKKTIKQLLAQSVDANLIGKEAVECGLELGLIDEDNITKIGEVPHAIFSIMSN